MPQYNKKNSNKKDFTVINLFEFDEIKNFINKWDDDDLEARRDDIYLIIRSIEGKISGYREKMRAGQFTSVEKKIDAGIIGKFAYDEYSTEHYSPEARELLQLEKNLAQLELKYAWCVAELRIERAIEAGKDGYDLDEDNLTVCVKKALYKFSGREFMIIKMLYEVMRLNKWIHIDEIRTAILSFELERQSKLNLIQQDELEEEINENPMSYFIGGTSEKSIFRSKYIESSGRKYYRLKPII